MTARSQHLSEALEQRLLARGASFDFLPLVRLLRRAARERGWDEQDAVRIRPALALDLPRARVVEVKRDDERQHYELQTTFLGLYGVSSPLPAFYTEELIAAAQEDRDGARLFLDVLNQRLYQLYIAAMEKYRPLVADVEGDRGQLREILRGFIGLRDKALAADVPGHRRLLRYVGLLAPRQRSAEGLRVMLTDALNGVPVDVEQCVTRMVVIPERARLSLGQHNHRLGDSTVLGEQTEDATGKLRIVIGPLDLEAFRALVHDADRWRLLVALIRFYLPAPLECELRLCLNAEAPPTRGLGLPGSARLGVDLWLSDWQGEAARQGLEANIHLG